MRFRTLLLLAAAQIISLIPGSSAIIIDVDSTDSLINGAKIIAESLAKEYTDQTGGRKGLLPDTYDFWISGSFYTSLINYAAWTGDDQFVRLLGDDFFAQIGENEDFQPRDLTESEFVTNQDVAIWGLAAITAAEFDIKAPNGKPSFLTLAENAFNSLASRWDEQTCGGGLRSVIFASQPGYDFKDTQTNGAFFQLAARLGHKTGNTTYLDWAQRIKTWTLSIDFYSAKDVTEGTAITPYWGHIMYDGASVTQNCSRLQGTAVRYDGVRSVQNEVALALYYGGDALILSMNETAERSNYYLNVIGGEYQWFSPQTYTPNDPMNDVLLANGGHYYVKNGDKDNQATDARAGRTLIVQALAFPQAVTDTSEPNIHAGTPYERTAIAAARNCNDDGDCDDDWYNTSYNRSSSTGAGQKMAALEAIINVLRYKQETPILSVFDSVSQGSGGDENEPSSSTTQPPSSSPTEGAPTESVTDRPNSAGRAAVSSALVFAAFVSLITMLL